MKKVIIAILTFCFIFILCGSACLFILLYFAGPHNDFTPEWMVPILFILGIVFTFTVAILGAKKVS